MDENDIDGHFRKLDRTGYYEKNPLLVPIKYADEVRVFREKLKQLEEENRRLKRLVAQQALDIQAVAVT